MPFTIEIHDGPLRDLLTRLREAGEDMTPVYGEIGEDVTLRVKQRFGSGTDPDGNPWAPNSDTVLRRLLHSKKGSFTKTGALSAKGEQTLAGKRPLVDSGSLRDTIYFETDGDGVTVGSGLKYAGVHQFGARKGQFGVSRRGLPIPWGDIPARRFMPLTADAEIDPDEERLVLELIERYYQQIADN